MKRSVFLLAVESSFEVVKLVSERASPVQGCPLIQESYVNAERVLVSALGFMTEYYGGYRNTFLIGVFSANSSAMNWVVNLLMYQLRTRQMRLL